MTRLSAWQIGLNWTDLCIGVYNNIEGKWLLSITRGPQANYPFMPILTSNPVFTTKADAVAMVEELLTIATKETNPLVALGSRVTEDDISTVIKALEEKGEFATYQKNNLAA